ncbi:HAD-IC family P-type ATPase [Patescibacteria group bacterium]|nr:HAD-IC family P-type ATPase [Patescibacteria group bacterium]MBU1951386.1 HAD-IC family P-type ATPase [Patescibacteria group bacterium]
MADQKLYNLSVEGALTSLTTTKNGLSTTEAQDRLQEHGLNKLPEEKKASWLLLLLSQFRNSLVYILLVAAVISFFLEDYIDMSVILAAVFVNVVVGFIQEYKANQAMEKLKKVITFLARVKRDDQEQEIKAEELVPGDIVLLKAGDKIPADGRIIFSKDLRANEASLTGESVPVKKDEALISGEVVLGEQKNMVFLGTVIVQGMAEIVVTKTGINTELGKIAALIKETPEEHTPFQKKLDKFSRLLGYLAPAVAIIIMVIGVLQGIPFVQIFTTSVAVAVSAIPEGLVIAVTAILAIGMQRILKQKALVKKLVAAETLGSTTVICTDKTGTLTLGDMRVSKLVTLNHDLEAEQHLANPGNIKEQTELSYLFRIGTLCNDAVIQNPEDEFSMWKMIGNPTERALLSVGARLGFHRESLEKDEPRLDEIPFDSDKKYMLTLHRGARRNILYLKGAPERIIEMSKKIQNGTTMKPLSKSLISQFDDKFEEMSRTGLRILAFAYLSVPTTVTDLNNGKQIKEYMDQFVFVGFTGIKDPLRKEAKETIKLCKQAGIKIVMITGDHKLTAQAIAKELGLKSNPENIMEGSELASIRPEQLAEKVQYISVYARVTPKDKLQIVHAWQKRGEVVAMTGDGVNDAPAIKAADIGIALGSGSDVAKETSDLVILDDNFKTIVAAVEQGRIIFDNIKKVFLYLLSDSFAEITLIVGSILVSALFIKDFPLPLLASQILWINLVDDSFPSIALTLEPGERDVMKEPPGGQQKTLFTSEMKALTVIISTIMGIGSLILFWYLTEHGWDVVHARTLLFTIFAISTLLYVFSVRSVRRSVFKMNIFANKPLLLAVAVGFGLQLIAVYLAPLQKLLHTVPLNWADWGIVLIASFILIALIEMTKGYYIHKRSKQN